MSPPQTSFPSSNHFFSFSFSLLLFSHLLDITIMSSSSFHQKKNHVFFFFLTTELSSSYSFFPSFLCDDYIKKGEEREKQTQIFFLSFPSPNLNFFSTSLFINLPLLPPSKPSPLLTTKTLFLSPSLPLPPPVRSPPQKLRWLKSLLRGDGFNCIFCLFFKIK